MKVFQLKVFYFHHKRAILKTILLLMVLLFGLFNVNAQKQSNAKLKIETGGLWDWVGGKIYTSGFFLNVEPKLKVSKKAFIGLRLGAALNTQRILSADRLKYYINNFDDTDTKNNNNGVISIVPTFDYYFSKKKFRPYLGLGIGYNFLMTSQNALVAGSPLEVFELSVNNKLGFLLRGGMNLPKLKIGRLDLSKIIVGLELNYIPKADVKLSNGQKIGTIVNSNIALSFGYMIGKS